MDRWALILELLVLVLLLISVIGVFQVWMNVWGVILIGVILGGIVIPLLLHWRPTLLGTSSTPIAAILVLIGGFLLRAAIVMSSESIGEVTTWLTR
jgi:hypothetical protein